MSTQDLYGKNIMALCQEILVEHAKKCEKAITDKAHYRTAREWLASLINDFKDNPAFRRKVIEEAQLQYREIHTLVDVVK